MLSVKSPNRDPEYPTARSMVFDPQDNHVYIGLHGDFNRIYRLSMEANTGVFPGWPATVTFYANCKNLR